MAGSSRSANAGRGPVVVERTSLGIILVALVGLLSACAAACSSRTSGIDPPPDCAALSHTCPATMPSWQNDVKPLVATYCTQCHDAGGDGQSLFDATTYENVFKGRGTMETELLECGMPPAGTTAPAPDSTQRQTMVWWLVCGAPDN
jgi:cytochrome c5